MQGNKNIVTDSLSRFPITGNKETTHDSTYKQEIVLENNDTKELVEDISI